MPQNRPSQKDQGKQDSNYVRINNKQGGGILITRYIDERRQVRRESKINMVPGFQRTFWEIGRRGYLEYGALGKKLIDRRIGNAALAAHLSFNGNHLRGGWGRCKPASLVKTVLHGGAYGQEHRRNKDRYDVFIGSAGYSPAGLPQEDGSNDTVVDKPEQDNRAGTHFQTGIRPSFPVGDGTV